MIESGSLTPGVSADDFGLPPHTALRYELPDPALAGYFTDYHVFDSEGPLVQNAVNWILPSWPAIRVILADRKIVLTLGNRTYDPLPVAALYGTTSQAMEMTSSGGVTAGAGVSPLGWSRLFRTSADAVRDRIVPLDSVMSPLLVEKLVADLAAGLDNGRGVKPVFDAFFLEHIGPVDGNEPEIRAMIKLITDDTTHDLATAAAEIGISQPRLRRLSKRYFGFPPKTLLLRTRFLRAFLRMMESKNVRDYSQISSAYHDSSHFLRDANRFLGMTPRRFMAMETRYFEAALNARRAVMHAARRAGG